MANKKWFCTLKSFLIFVVMIFVNAGFLCAQENKFVQKLEWEKDENALEYRFEIKRIDDEEILKTVVTADSFVELSFPSGKYLYRVTTFDFLGRESFSTDWIEVFIEKALKPEISVKEEAVVVKEKDLNNVFIPVNVEKVSEKSNIELINIETAEIVKGKIGEKKIEDEEEFSIHVSDLKPGKWVLKITNPGGLYSESKVIEVKPEGKKVVIAPEEVFKKQKVTAEIEQKEKEAQEKIRDEEEARQKELALIEQKEKEAQEKKIAEEEARQKEIALIEQKEKEEAEKAEKEKAEAEAKAKKKKKIKMYVESDIGLLCGINYELLTPNEITKIGKCTSLPISLPVNAKINFLPFNVGNIKVGFEANFSRHEFKYENDILTAIFGAWIIDADLLLRADIKKDVFGIVFRLGGGVSLLKKDFKYKEAGIPEYTKGNVFYGYPCVSAGVGLQCIIVKHIVIEGGIDYKIAIVPDLQFHLFEPYLCIGARF